jgi:hypothetical protein
MPFPDDPLIDPTTPETESSAPWGWVPPEWLGGAAAMPTPAPAAPPPPPATPPSDPLTSGPLDTAAPPLAPPPLPSFGLELGAMPAPGDALPAPMGAAPMGVPMQPGLGMPAATVDQALAAGIDGDLAPPVDAISGSEGPPPGTDLSRIEHTGGYAAALDRDPSDRERAEGAAWMYGADPVSALLMEEQQARKLGETRETRQREIELDDQAREEANRRRYDAAMAKAQAKHDQIEDDARTLAATEVDPDRWWESRSTAQTIAGYIAAALGGLTQHLNGGKNLGLEAINSAIDRDIDAQKANLQNKRAMLGERRGLVSELFQRTGDLNQAAETARLAGKTRALNQLEGELQRYDMEGSRFMRIGKVIAAQRAEIAEGNRRGLAEQRKQALEEDKRILEWEKAKEDARKNKANERLEGWKVSSENKRAADRLDLDERKLTAEERKAQRDLDKEEAKANRELGMGGSVRIKRDAKGAIVVDQSTGKPVMERSPLMMADGKTQWRGKSPEQSDDIAKKYAAAEDVVSMIDEIIDIRDRVGGESSTFNSDDAQRMKVLEAQILMRTKQGTQGMSSDADMAVLKDAVGAQDVNSFRERAAGLEKGRERVIASLNRDLRFRGQYDGEPVTFENPFQAAPKTTPEEEERKEIMKKPAVSVDEADRQAAAIVRKRYSDAEWSSPANAKQISAEMRTLAADYKEISPEQKIRIQRLGDLAGGSGPVAERAARDLADIAQNGQTPKLRAAAEAAQGSANMSKGGR